MRGGVVWLTSEKTPEYYIEIADGHFSKINPINVLNQNEIRYHGSFISLWV